MRILHLVLCFWFIFLILAVRTASAESYWLWAIDGRYEKSPSPCADDGPNKTNPAKQAILAWIGTDTHVIDDNDELVLKRGSAIDKPKKLLEGPNGLIGIWHQGSRSWIVTLYPRVSPAFASVTLVIERNKERRGKPVCQERWIAPVSP